jgi:hypothetical protein
MEGTGNLPDKKQRGKEAAKWGPPPLKSLLEPSWQNLPLEMSSSYHSKKTPTRQIGTLGKIASFGTMIDSKHG